MNVLGIPPGCLAVLIGIIGFVFALILFFWIRGRDAGTDLMKEISEQIDEILTNVSNGSINFEQAKEYMALVSSGYNLQELPKLMAQLDALENK